MAGRSFRDRQFNVVGGRAVRHVVKVTPEQELELVALAQDRGVTVARLLVDSALDRERNVIATRDDLVQLFALSNLVAAVGRNINQLTKVANSTGEFPAELRASLDAVYAMVRRLDEVSRAITGRA